MHKSISELILTAEKRDLSISEIIIEAEAEQSQLSVEKIIEKMARRLQVMKRSVDKGLSRSIQSISGLSGGRAHKVWGKLSAQGPSLGGSLLAEAVARALAIGEVNAGMGCIVATPTAGSAGVLPAVLLTLQSAYQIEDARIVRALFTAGGFGMVIASRASISGAAGGCQAEIGSAAAMTSAAVVELLGGTPRQSAHAAAITLANMLGLVCDPVAGLVEIPCILRNAGAVGQVFVSVELALAGVESIIPVDEVIDAMQRIGQGMDHRLRETAQGGLAATPTGRRLAEHVWQAAQVTEQVKND